MHDGLCSYDETRTNLYCLCTKHECCCKASAICNTTCGDDRNAHCINDLWHQCHRCGRTDVSAALHSFCDNSVCAASLHELCHGNTGNDRNDLYACCLPHFHVLCRISCSSRDDLHTLIHNHLCNRVCFRIHQHEIYAKRLICNLLYLLNLLSDKLSGCTAGTNNSQSSCF